MIWKDLIHEVNLFRKFHNEFLFFVKIKDEQYLRRQIPIYKYMYRNPYKLDPQSYYTMETFTIFW